VIPCFLLLLLLVVEVVVLETLQTQLMMELQGDLAVAAVLQVAVLVLAVAVMCRLFLHLRAKAVVTAGLMDLPQDREVVVAVQVMLVQLAHHLIRWQETVAMELYPQSQEHP